MNIKKNYIWGTILGIIVLFGIVILLQNLNNYKLHSYDNYCESTEQNNNKDYENEANNLFTYFVLGKENEVFIYDDILTISFTGTEYEEDFNWQQYIYNYIANISINDKSIGSNIFTDKNNMKIWSDNYGAEFGVAKIKNFYIIISSVASQFNGDYILIIDDNGKIITSYDNLAFVKDSLKEENGIVIYGIEDCLNRGIEEQCDYKRYTIK